MANKIRQVRIPSAIIDWEDENWSKNLLSGFTVQLSIYAKPGTRFKINQNNSVKAEELIINGSGLFSMSFEDVPISSLSLHKNDYESIGDHFIIIDEIYEEVYNNE